MWSVLVVAQDPEKNAMFVLSPDTTIAEVKRRWQKNTGCPIESIMRRSDRSRLSDHQLLTEVGEVSAGSKTITVFVDEAVEVTVGFYKSQTDERKPVAISLSEKPEAIHREIRAVFGLAEDRLFRLRTEAAPLKYDLTFEQQGVGAGGVLLIDPGFKLDVVEEWSSAVETRLMFASEAATELTSESDRLQKLLLGGVEMKLGSDILDALPHEYRRTTQVFLQRRQQSDITMMVNSFLKQMLVWPTDLTGKLIENCPPLRSELLFEKERLPTTATFKEMKLPEHAVVHTLTRVSVKGSDGKLRVIPLPDFATVADLEAVVSQMEGTTRFSLKCGGRHLERSDKIAKLVIDGRSIEVEELGDAVTVCLRDRSVRFRSDQRRMTFTELMTKVAEKSELQLTSLTDRELQCEGCGRRLTLAEEAFQAVPADCCRVRSLKLKEPVVRDVGTQARCPSAGRTVGRRRRRVGATQQTERSVVVASTQVFPDRSAAPRPFRVFNDRGIGDVGTKVFRGKRNSGHIFNADLRLSDTPTVAEVRSAVAAHMAVPLEEVELLQKIGRRHRDGEIVFNAFDDRRYFWRLGYADTTGTWSHKGEVAPDEVVLQDADPFTLVPGFRNALVVLPR